jgi:hypothetical protein
MRGVIRKMFKVNTWYYIIGLSLLLVGIFLVGQIALQESYAISKSDLEELKEEKINMKNEIKDLIIIKNDQLEILKIDYLKVKLLNSELKKIETLADWNSLKLKQVLEDQLIKSNLSFNTAQTNYDNSISKLLSIIQLSWNVTSTIENSVLDNLPDVDTKIGIKISSTCETMLKNNFTTNCPTYKQLEYLDTSDISISGNFTTDENGFYHRGDERVSESYKFYWKDTTTRVFVDPPSSMVDKMKMIYIQSNFNTFIFPQDIAIDDKFEIQITNKTDVYGENTKFTEYRDRVKIESFGLVSYNDRYIDDCKIATISADNWQFLVEDTLHFMINNCDIDYTNFEEREITSPIKTEIDLTTSPNWVYQQWVKNTVENCTSKYKECE